VLADDDQGSRFTVAGARSRVHWQSLG
jgi:hypothetical protein